MSVSGPELGSVQNNISRPYAVVGRSTSADLILPDQTVSLRHLYLQKFGNRLFACDLFSANGTTVSQQPFLSGWVEPGGGLTIGPYTLHTDEESAGSETPEPVPPPDKFRPREGGSDFYGTLPEVSLELVGHPKQASWPINRVLTLLGRDSRCRITCGHESVSAVHAAFLLTQSGLWVVDLASRTGVIVNGEARTAALLPSGNEFRVGRYRLRAHMETPPQPDPPPPNPAGETAGPAERIKFLTRNHRIFRLETDGTDALIVSPQGDLSGFLYKDVQTEANAVVHAVTNHGFRHLVVDFAAVPIVGSVIIESIASFCRAAGGKAALCSATPEMYQVLDDMKLNTIWLHYANREDALAAVRYVEA